MWHTLLFLLQAFRRTPLCCPPPTMRSACTLLLALAAAALCSDPDLHRTRHDSNLDICILPPAVDCELECSGINNSAHLTVSRSGCRLFVHYVAISSPLLVDKRLFETKRKDQLNALKNLIELNDINQQYKIIDIMLKGLFKVGV